jgi:Protein of unknown function (DUF2490)
MRRIACAVLVLLIPGRPAHAQADTQLWAEITLSWIKSHQFTYGLDVEPKVLVWAPEGDPGWATLDLTPSIEYSHGLWLDVLGELLVGRTRQTDDLDSTELTPRIGMRLHLFSNLRNELTKEKHPKRRLVVKDLIRIEWRNLYYSTDKPDSSALRLRNRVEMSFAITRPRVTDDGATYVLSDVEWFWSDQDPDERYASKQRIRAGLGYRHGFAWRFEALYIWNRSRNTLDEGFTTADNIVDFRMKRVW